MQEEAPARTLWKLATEETVDKRDYGVKRANSTKYVIRTTVNMTDLQFI